jgi:hypothetical protein
MAPALSRAALALAPGFLAAEAGDTDIFLVGLLEQALEALADEEPGLEARLASRLAMALHWSDRDAQRRELIRRARAAAGKSCDPAVALHVLHARWLGDWARGGFEEREWVAEELVRESETIGDREMLLLGMLFRMVGLLERGNIASFDSAVKRFSCLASEIRQPQSLWYSEMLLAMRALLDGNFAATELHAAKSFEIAEKVQDANATHSLMAQTALVKWERGELESILPMLTVGVSKYPWVPGWRAGLAWVLCKLGNTAAAAREFELLAQRDFSDIPERFDWATAVAFISETCWHLRDDVRAGLLIEMLEPLSDRFLVLGLGVASLGPAARYLGLLHELLGHDDDASRFLVAAVRKCHASGARAWAAHCEFEQARFLLSRRKDSSTALRLLAGAESLSGQLGMVALHQEAAALLELVRGPHPPTIQATPSPAKRRS